jgi:amidase
MKPTLGLVSRTGILPIAASQDTAGPMTRTVADAAALLAAIAGPDPADAATADAASTRDALQALVLDPGALAGVRIGVVRPKPKDDEKHQAACHEQALTALREAGAELIDVRLPSIGHDDELVVLHYEFGPGVERYLAALGDGAPLRTLADLQAWNLAHADEALKYGQTHVDAAVAVDHALEHDAYRRARERDLRTTTNALLAALGDDLECLIFPGADGCSWAARAGWPSIVIPAGYTADSRRPVGLMLVGRPWTDARLLTLAYAAEQAYPARRTPAQINPATFRRLG